jgi:hypothetical protein
MGAEGTYNNWRVVAGPARPSAHVIGASVFFGHPVVKDKLDVWGSAGVLFFSDFKTSGTTVFEGGRGWQFNVGVDIPLGRRRSTR